MWRGQPTVQSARITQYHEVVVWDPLPHADLARLSLFSGSNDDRADPGVPDAEGAADASDELSDRSWRSRYVSCMGPHAGPEHRRDGAGSSPAVRTCRAHTRGGVPSHRTQGGRAVGGSRGRLDPLRGRPGRLLVGGGGPGRIPEPRPPSAPSPAIATASSAQLVAGARPMAPHRLTLNFKLPGERRER